MPGGGPNLRRLAAELQEGLTRQGTRPLYVDSAKVTATVHPSQAAGKAAVCSVAWKGGTFPATYDIGYTPVVNQVVFVLVQPPQGLTIFMAPKIA